jgi:acyl-CoA hydrolase
VETKTVAQTEVFRAKNITPYHCNSVGQVHAGEIMQFIYNTAYEVAKEHAHMNIVTAKVDELTFRHPIMVGSVVTCHAYLIFVGRSSMLIQTDLYVDGIQPRTLAFTAVLTMLAVDETRKPVPVPRLELVTDIEKERYAKAEKAYLHFKATHHPAQ